MKLREAAAWLALAAAVFFAARIGQAITLEGERAAILLLTCAVALVGLVHGGLRRWPAVFIGAWCEQALFGPSVTAAAAIAAGDTATALLGAWLLREGERLDETLARLRPVLKLGLGAALGASLVSAVVGTVTLVIAGAIRADDATQAAYAWWTATALGILVIAPIGFAWRADRETDRNVFVAIAAGGTLGLAITLLPALFESELGRSAARELVGFALFPAALMLAARLPPRAVVVFNLVIAFAAIGAWRAGIGHAMGPAGDHGSVGALAVLHGLLAFLVLTTLATSALNTERRRANAALAASEARFRSLTEMGNDWYWEQDAEGRFTLASNGMAAIGVEPEAVVGRTLDALPFDFTPHLIASYRRLVEAHRPFRDLMLRRRMEGGDIRHFLTSGDPVFAPDGRFLGYRGVGREITAERWAEDALRESEQRYASIFHHSAAAILVLRMPDEGDAFVIESCNPTGEALLEVRAHSLVGQALRGAMPSATAERLLTALDACVGSGERRTEHTDLAVASGVKRVVMTLVPVRRSGGRIERVLLIAIDVTAEARAEERVRQSERLFSEVFDGSPEPMMFSRLADGAIREVNVAWQRMFGVARDEAIGRDFASLGLVSDPAMQADLDRRLAAHENVREVDTPYRTRGGKLVYARYSGQVIDLHGEEVVVSNFVDVTERKRAERALSESRERFLKLFQASPLPVLLSRRDDGVLLEVNDAWCQIFGMTRDEVVGRSPVELGFWLSREDRERVVAPLLRGEPVRNAETRLRKRSGEIIDVLMSADVLDLDGQPQIAACLLDITDRKRAERHLRESERRFRDFADAAGEYVWETDAERRFTFVSDRVESVLGYGAQDLLGRTQFDLMPPGEAERVRAWEAEHAGPDGAFRNLECRALTRLGASVWLQTSAVPVTDAGGRVIGWRGTALDITERKLAAQRIEELATRDPLTGLPNRLLLQDRLQQGIAAATRAGDTLAVMFIDLDHFKRINDTLGHHVGDGLLKDVARRLSAVIRKGDTLARIGGDEFVIVLEGLKSSDDATQVAQKVLASLALPCEVDGHQLTTAGSVGISLCPTDGVDVATLMRHADTAMYAAKSGGRGSYQFFSSEMNSRAPARAQLEGDLRRALDGNELRMYFQPRGDVLSGRVTGIDARLRWRHPTRGLLEPERFIEVAAETGLIGAIGDWMIEAAVAQAKAWGALVERPVPVALSVSPRRFNAEFVEAVRASLARHALPPGVLEIELTEAALMRSIDEAEVIAARLRDAGCRLVVDDFGTGYSSMHYLRRLAVQGVKLDPALLRDLAADGDERIVVRAIVEMARKLGIAVIAEGVDTPEQLALLVELGCTEYSGALFLGASPPAEVERLLLAGSNVASLAARRAT